MYRVKPGLLVSRLGLFLFKPVALSKHNRPPLKKSSFFADIVDIFCEETDRRHKISEGRLVGLFISLLVYYRCAVA